MKRCSPPARAVLGQPPPATPLPWPDSRSARRPAVPDVAAVPVVAVEPGLIGAGPVAVDAALADRWGEPLLVRFAVGRNLLDMPNLRSSHEVPTPRLGGVAIFLGTLAGVALLTASRNSCTPVNVWNLSEPRSWSSQHAGVSWRARSVASPLAVASDFSETTFREVG